MPSRSRRDYIILAVFAAVAITAIVLGIKADWLSLSSLGTLVVRIRDAKGTGVLFTLLFIGVAAIGLPTVPLILIGGVLFGSWIGGLVSWGASLVGATIGYFLARLLGKNALRRLIERMAGHHVQFSGKKARKTMLRLRLIPLTPFGGLNFAAGLAGMRYRDFLIATALGIIPGIVILAVFASRVLTGSEGARHRAILHTLLAAGVLWALTYAPAVWDRFFGDKDEEDEADVLPHEAGLDGTLNPPR